MLARYILQTREVSAVITLAPTRAAETGSPRMTSADKPGKTFPLARPPTPAAVRRPRMQPFPSSLEGPNPPPKQPAASEKETTEPRCGITSYSP
jgi:hypothetical protein